MKRKILLGGITLVCVILFLVHTQPIERRILNVISKMASSRGIDLSASRLDLMLWKLQADMKNLRVSGPGYLFKVDDISVNAALPVLLGRIKLDHLLLNRGSLKLEPDYFPGSTADSQRELPQISIGRMEFRDFQLAVNQSSTDLDFKLNRVAMNYTGGNLHVDGGASLASWPAQILEYTAIDPEEEIRWSFDCHTSRFIDMDAMIFTLNSQGLNLLATGSMKELMPNVSLSGDLLFKDEMEMDPLHLDGQIGPNLILNACTRYTGEDRSLPVFLSVQSTRIPGLFPLDIHVFNSDLLDLDLMIENKNLDFTLVGECFPETLLPESVTSALKSENIEGARVTCGLKGCLNAFPVFSGFIALNAPGGRMLSFLEYKDRLEALSVQGGYELPSGHEGVFHAVGNSSFSKYGFQLQGGGTLLLPGTPSLAEDDSGYLVSLSVNKDREAPFQLEHLAFSADVPSLLGLEETVLNLEGSGDINAFQVDAALFQGDDLPKGKMTALMDVDRFLFSRLEGDVRGLRITGPSSLDAVVHASLLGSGPLDNPEASGDFDVLISQDGHSLGRIRSGFEKVGDALWLNGFALESRQVSAGGTGNVDLNSMNARLQAHAFSESHPEYNPVVDMILPAFSAFLSGDQESLILDPWFPPQIYRVNNEILVKLSKTDQNLHISGLSVFHPSLRMEQGRLIFEGHTAIDDANAFNQTLRAQFKDQIPNELNVTEVVASLSAEMDMFTECLNIRADVERVVADYEGNNLFLDPFHIEMNDDITVSPVKGNFEGNPVQCTIRDIQLEEGTFSSRFSLNLDRPETLNTFLHLFLPPDISVQEMMLSGELVSREELTGSVAMNGFKATAYGLPVEAQTLILKWDQGIQGKAEGLKVDGAPVEVTSFQDGLDFAAEVPAKQITLLSSESTGSFDVHFRILNTDVLPVFELLVDQDDLDVRVLDPELLLKQAHLHVKSEWDENQNILLHLMDANAEVNGGSTHASGTLFPIEKLSLSVEMEDIQGKLSQSVLDFSGDLKLFAADHKQRLEGYIEIHGGELFPEVTLDEVTELIAPSYPYLNFPDPFLENILLDLEVENVNPITISHEFGYLEVSMPSLLLHGTLAEPELYSGFIHIEPDSYLKLGKDVFLFKPSDILFQPERPGEPYLQIFLEYGRVDQPKSMQITGFSSDLENSPGATNITSFAGSFLLGKYTNKLLSLEYHNEGDLKDASFSAIIEKQLGSKIYTRYVVPLDLKKETQRIELGFGPFSGLFMTATQTIDDLILQTRKTFKFGGGKATGPVLKKMSWTFPDQVSTREKWWIRKRWSLKKGNRLSPGRLRQARKLLLGSLKEKGYFHAEVSTSQKGDQAIAIQCNPGLKYQILTQGHQFSKANLQLLSDSNLVPDHVQSEAFRSLINSLVLSEGYLPGSVEAAWEADKLNIDIRCGSAIQDYRVNVTGANKVLADMLKNEKWRKSFIELILLEPGKAKKRLKGWLAAQGYLQPVIGRGFYDEDLKMMTVPVQTGPRAELAGFEFYENLENRYEVSMDLLDLIQNELVLPPLFQPFDSSLLDKSIGDMQAQLKGRYFVTLKARPNGRDIVFQFYLRPRKKDVFHEINFSGLNRLPEKSLIRLAHLPESATYSNLIHAQKRILEAGQFYGVQLITKGQTATFKLQERNRFDLSLGVNYSEKDAYGSSIQLMDRMFLRRPNDLVLRFETGREKDQLLSKIILRNFLKSPGNLIMFGQWWKEKNSLPVRIPDGWGGFEVSVDLITNQKYALEYEIPLSDTQDLNFGGEFILARTDTTVKYLDDLEEEWQDPEMFSNLNTFFPLNLSWSLKSFDRNNNPRNGLLSTASLSYFIPSFSEDDIGGTRWAVGATLYKSFSRWTGVHRIKTGIYDPSDEDFLGLGEDNPTKFYLGGSTSLRGYRANTVGPYDPEQEEGLGGNAMLFLSEEWAYHTGYYGFSFAGFVDAGQIWKSKDDITLSDIKYSAGLGIIFDSPAGLFRVDYAVPLDEENDEIKENWTLKFGAVF